MNNHERGYQDFYNGVQFDENETEDWQDGWCAGQYECYLENSNLGDLDE